MDNLTVEQVTISLVREYLCKKNFRKSLETLNLLEEKAFPGICDRRAPLAKVLGLEPLLKENKRGHLAQTPLRSILEVLVKAFLSSKDTKNRTTQTELSGKKISISTQTEKENGKMSERTTTRISRSRSNSSSGSGSPARSFSRSQSSKSPIRDSGSSNDDPNEAPESPPYVPSAQQFSFDNEFHLRPAPGVGEEKELSLPEVALKSMQNILAQGCLSKAEISKHHSSHKIHETVDLKPAVETLCDIEDDELDFGGRSSSANFMHVRKAQPSQIFQKKSQLELGTWRKLKQLVLGTRPGIPDGWVGQGFVFNPKIPYGLVQNKGGPCGVLAVVQGLLLRNLCFSGFDLKAIQSLTDTTNGLIPKRSQALAEGLAEILWRCGSCNEESEKQVVICWDANSPGSELIVISSWEECREFVSSNLYRFDCVGLVYSSVLTRGIDRVASDMDFPDSSLIGAHGYCTQELVNLLLLGVARSNVFNHEIDLDGKVLRGVNNQAEIGLLSLFEHYGSCEVGGFLKSPKFPIWIVCSESHFSILFSLPPGGNTERTSTSYLDLFYYDGLARQESNIKLTLHLNSSINRPQLHHFGDDDDPLVPPLEKCIRTKWKEAKVDWNGTEPLL